MEKIQLHYFLENDGHSMNAFARNKAELELLRLLDYMSKTLSLDLTFETEALEEGGIKEFIKAVKHKKNTNLLIILAYFGGIFTDVLTGVITDFVTKDAELEMLEKEEKKLNIEKIKLEIEKLKTTDVESEKIDSVQNIRNFFLLDGKTKVLKSNFYSFLNDENKLTKISTLELDHDNSPISDEKFVSKSEFKKFIVKEIELEPKTISDAEIEVISPVFKKGNDSWKGVLNGEPIDFKIKDQIFKQKVLNRQVSFTTGTKILCELEIIIVLDKKGEPKVKSRNAYDIALK